jgi:hypothetical protein
LYTKEEYDLYISYQKSFNMNFSLQQRAKRFVEKHERLLRRAHLIEQAAVNNGFVPGPKVTQPADQALFKLSWLASEEAKWIYARYRFDNPQQLLRSRIDGVVGHSPKDEPTWFKRVPSPRKRVSYHRLPTEFYKYDLEGDPIIFDSFHPLPDAVKIRKHRIDTVKDITTSVSAGSMLTAIPTAIVVSFKFCQDHNWSSNAATGLISVSALTATALGCAAIRASRRYTPKLIVNIRHAVERTGMNVLKAIAGKQP